MAEKAANSGEQPYAPRLATATEVAGYITEMLGELEKMAASAGLVELHYALREARDTAQGA